MKCGMTPFSMLEINTLKAKRPRNESFRFTLCLYISDEHIVLMVFPRYLLNLQWSSIATKKKQCVDVLHFPYWKIRVDFPAKSAKPRDFRSKFRHFSLLSNGARLVLRTRQEAANFRRSTETCLIALDQVLKWRNNWWWIPSLKLTARPWK